MLAVLEDRPALVDRLTAAGADVDAVNSVRFILTLSLSADVLDVCDYNYYIPIYDLTVCMKVGDTSLIIAAQSGLPCIVGQLVAAGAHLDSTNEVRYTLRC